MNRPLVVLAFFFAAGILAGEAANIQSSTALALAFFSFFTAVTGCILAWKENRRVILILFFLLGMVLARIEAEKVETQLAGYTGQRVVMTGRVMAEPDVREDKVFYPMQAQELIKAGERHAVSGTVRLQASEASQVFAYGDVLMASGLLIRPEPAGNPGGFDYRTYLERHGIKVVLLARGQDAVQKTGIGGSNPFLNAALKLKQKLSAAATASLTPSQSAVLNGVLFGTQGLIDRDTRWSFQKTGVVHILSVSGLHVGLVLGGIFGLMRLLRLPPNLTAAVTTPALIFYALMTGLNPAVLRATIMALLLVWAHHLGRERDWPTTLAFAALVMLAWKPLELFSPGFQLSFTATWGILYLGPVFTGTFSRLFKNLPGNMALPAAQALSIPLAAQMAAVPLVAWYYNLVSLVSIPANLLAVPLVGLVMGLGMFAACLGMLWLPLAVFINASTAAVLDLFLALIGIFQRLPGAVVYLATPPLLLAMAWYGALTAAAAAYNGWRPVCLQRLKGWVPAGAMTFVVVLLIWWPWGGGNRLTVHFLDVGQGDSILVQTPGGKNMLIDAGGRPGEFLSGSGTGEQVVAPYLRSIGVSRIDALVLTHPHEDHSGGAVFLIDNFPVDLAVVSTTGDAGNKGDSGVSEGASDIPDGYKALLDKIALNGTPLQVAESGDTLRLEDGVFIEVLAPKEDAVQKEQELNNISLVLKMTYGRRSFIFTGDVESEAQKELIRTDEVLRADVLKMPHHGSRTLLPELLEQIQPEVAVISVGAHNTFGHPSLYTLDLLDRCGARVYRTDQDGAVIVQTDGNYLKIWTGKKRD